jgi:hypothetical protein
MSTVKDNTTYNYITVTAEAQNAVEVTQPVTKVVEVHSLGPQGPSSVVNGILTLTPQNPLPSNLPTGSFAVSSSIPPKPYFWDGSNWNALY